jgi:hypothetical protein
MLAGCYAFDPVVPIDSRWIGWIRAAQMGIDFAHQTALEDSHGSDETALPRGACWQFAAPGTLDGRPRAIHQRENAKSGAERIEDECIREAVAMQERVEIGAITDGENRKRGWREFL